MSVLVILLFKLSNYEFQIKPLSFCHFVQIESTKLFIRKFITFDLHKIGSDFSRYVSVFTTGLFINKASIVQLTYFSVNEDIWPFIISMSNILRIWVVQDFF
jgi:hypothetical protein